MLLLIGYDIVSTENKSLTDSYFSGWNWAGTSQQEVYYFVANMVSSVIGW
jgi:hypothetical protein